MIFAFYICLVQSTIYRVKIMNLFANQYLQRSLEYVKLTKNNKAAKTDFFIDLADTKGNIKDATIFEHVKHQSPRYLSYEKVNNRLSFHNIPSKFRIQYNKNAFLIKTGSPEECLHVENDRFYLKPCENNSKNQEFTIQVLKKMKTLSKQLKSNTKMDVEVKGQDVKHKDKKTHRDDITINYLDDSSATEENEEISHLFSDEPEFDFVKVQTPYNGNYQVTSEIKKNVQEEPALLYKENVSNILYSTLYTTLIVNSTKTVYTTIYQTITSSVLNHQTKSVYYDQNDQFNPNSRGDEKIEANVPIFNNKYDYYPSKTQNFKHDDLYDVRMKRDLSVKNEKEYCKYIDSPECDRLKNKSKKQKTSNSYFNGKNFSDFSDEELFGLSDNYNSNDQNKDQQEFNFTDNEDNNSRRLSKWKKFKNSTKKKIKRFFNNDEEDISNTERMKSKKSTKDEENDFIKKQKERKPQSVGLLHYVGFNDSIDNNLLKDNDDSIYSGVRIDI